MMRSSDIDRLFAMRLLVYLFKHSFHGLTFLLYLTVRFAWLLPGSTRENNSTSSVSMSDCSCVLDCVSVRGARQQASSCVFAALWLLQTKSIS